MSECYKCGRVLSGSQVECDPPCSGEQESNFSDEQVMQAIKDYEKNTVQIDWDKVKTVDDLKEVFRNLMYDDRIHKESLAYELLKRFLKSE
jgi:hypothetical protein